MADQAQGSVTTSIDDLVKYIDEHGETDSFTLAKDLGVSEPVIETWANVLEKANIVKISYKVGKMYIAKAIASKEEEESIRKTSELKRSTLESEAVAQTQMLNEIGTRIDAFRKYMLDVENIYKEKAGNIKEVMDRINAYENELSGVRAKIAENQAYIDSVKNGLEASLSALGEKANVLSTMANNPVYIDAEKLLQDLVTKANYEKKASEELAKEIDARLESFRKLMLETSEAARKEAKQLDTLISQLEDQIASYKQAMANYSKDADKLKHQIAADSQRLVDEFSKAAQRASALQKAAQQDADKLESMLNEIKQRFPEIAQLSDSLASINRDLEKASKEKEELAKELQELSQQLQALKALSEAEIGKKAEGVHNAEERAGKASQRLKKLGKSVDEIDEKIKKLGKGK
mgnify:FL=1